MSPSYDICYSGFQCLLFGVSDKLNEVDHAIPIAVPIGHFGAVFVFLKKVFNCFVGKDVTLKHYVRSDN